MALYKFQNLNKYGTLRTRILYRPTTQLIINPRGLGDFINAQIFRYEYNHGYMQPQLQIHKGEKYIIPGDIKVHPETTFDDIVWVKPKKQKRTEPIIETYTSSSNGGEYKTKYFPDSGNYQCSCPGTWRAKDRRCKHIKELESKNGKKR
tara:strand:+ start:1962 stop:2408 length:447 start_codon:yes stop_codon:yes gene_type:complete